MVRAAEPQEAVRSGIRIARVRECAIVERSTWNGESINGVRPLIICFPSSGTPPRTTRQGTIATRLFCLFARYHSIMGDVASFVALLQNLVDGVGLRMDRERITREATPGESEGEPDAKQSIHLVVRADIHKNDHVLAARRILLEDEHDAAIVFYPTRPQPFQLAS